PGDRQRDPPGTRGESPPGGPCGPGGRSYGPLRAGVGRSIRPDRPASTEPSGPVSRRLGPVRLGPAPGGFVIGQSSVVRFKLRTKDDSEPSKCWLDWRIRCCRVLDALAVAAAWDWTFRSARLAWQKGHSTTSRWNCRYEASAGSRASSR